jgi:glutamyl endopeptidase
MLLSRSNSERVAIPSVPRPEARAIFNGFAGEAAAISKAALSTPKPSGAGANLSVFEDGWQIEASTTSAPWRMICSLKIHTANGIFRGTGWLCGPSLLITCGHCVHSARFGGWAREISIAPGFSWGAAPFGRTVSRNFSCPDEWQAGGSKDHDIGCVHLNEPVGNTVGWFKTKSVPPSGLQSGDVSVAGYPQYDGGYDLLLRHTGAVRTRRNGRVFYHVDTKEGQSGGPVWMANDDPIAPHVVAVHTYEKEQTPPDIPQDVNSGTVITSDVLDLILRWQSAPQLTS